MTLGEQITSLRKKKAISQGDLGKKIGTSGDIIGRYERNEVKPSIEVAIKIADALEVSLDYLVGNTDVMLDKTILEKVISIQKLPDEDKNCIMYSIDGLIQHAKTRLAYK